MSSGARLAIGIVCSLIAAVVGPFVVAFILGAVFGPFDSSALQWILLVVFLVAGIVLTIRWAERAAKPHANGADRAGS